MATNTPREVIDIHNDMVFELSNNIVNADLEALKFLLQNNPLTTVALSEIDSVAKLFTSLMNTKFISYGNYEKLVPKLGNVKPILCDVVQRYTDAITKCTEDIDKTEEEMAVQMDEPKYHVNEGSAVILHVMCTVDPKPDSILWKKGDKSPPPRVSIDNQKYFSGCPNAPLPVIKNTNKDIDEAHYQCRANAKNRKAEHGLIVQLHVSAEKYTRSEDDLMESKLPVSQHEETRQREDIDQDECPICRLSYGKGKARKLTEGCGHHFCFTCVNKHEESCPICEINKPDTSSTQGAQPIIDAADTKEQQNTAKRTNIKEIHAEMITSLSMWIDPNLPKTWRDFQTLMDAHLSSVDVFGHDFTCLDDICWELLGKGIIAYGKYDTLRSAVVNIHVEAARIVDDASSKIFAI